MRICDAISLGTCALLVVTGCDDDGGTSAFQSQNQNPTADARADTPSGLDVAGDTLTAADVPVAADAGVVDVFTPADSTGTADTASQDTGGSSDTATADVVDPGPTGPVDINVGFIGGACTSVSSCTFADSQCRTEAQGFPGGHCTQACDKFCPDAEGAATTFCIDQGNAGLAAGAGMCVQRCDFGASPSGCRDGYKCEQFQRFNDPATVNHVCVPGIPDDLQLSPCIQTLLDRGIGFELASNPMSHPEGYPDKICDISDPVWVDGVLSGVSYRYQSTSAAAKRIFAGCALAVAMDDLAKQLAADGVTDVIHLGVYHCRFIGTSTNLSEHAFANAIDIASVRLAGGTIYDVEDDWDIGVSNPTDPADAFLKAMAQKAFDDGIFNIILTPEFNPAHRDHLHCDLTPGASTLNAVP